jgi:hypothetical protein
MANYEFLIENLTSQDNSKYFYRSTQWKRYITN